ncbi:MAG: POTRA domain-containing protein [Coleofasciculus sp. G1-WW12-02]|uniref:POTRA domain-containing protein n=1 Tax=Coleofasciculus sp. G1-WW12-02 TaxID=3068483 RepID=UPI003300E007
MIQTKLLIIGGFTLISTLEQGYALANSLLNLPEPTKHFPAFDFAQQPNPNEDRFLQPTPEPIPSEPTETEPVLPTPEEPVQPPPSEPTETTINVSTIEVVGGTVFGAQELNPIIQPLEGRTVTIQELQNATDAIALWEPIPNLNLRLDYGIPFVDLDDQRENAQDEGFHFSVGYQF